MKVLVQDESKTLAQLFTQAQLAQIRSVKSSERANILLYNNSTDTIYIEIGAAATETDSYFLMSGDSISFPDRKYEDVNLLSDGENSDLRVLIN